MDETQRMNGFERLEHLDVSLNELFFVVPASTASFLRPLFKALAEGLTLQVFAHHACHLAIVVEAEHLQDARMAQSAEKPRLLPHPCRNIATQGYLDCHITLQVYLVG